MIHLSVTLNHLKKRLAARMLIEDKLIIDGNRVSLPDVVLLKEKGIDKELLAYLHETHHILRCEPNTTGGISYELSHDTLVAPILKAKKEREDKEELARLEAEKQKQLTLLEAKKEAEFKQERENAEREKAEREKERKNPTQDYCYNFCCCNSGHCSCCVRPCNVAKSYRTNETC